MQNENEEQMPDLEHEEWSAEEIAEQATNKESDEIVRQIARGDETDGDADERDIAGSPETSETPHGREATKNNQ